MPITKRFIPYAFSSQLELRAMDPWDVPNEARDFTWLIRPDQSNDEVLTMDLSGREDWSLLEFTLRSNLSEKDLARVLPSLSDASDETILLVSVSCPQTKLRHAIRLQPLAEGGWKGKVRIRRDSVRGVVRLSPRLVRAKARPDAPAGYGRDVSLVLAEGRDIALVVDPKDAPPQGVLNTRWVDFGEGKESPHYDPWRHAHVNDLFHLDISSPTPILYLNSRHGGFRDALESRNKMGAAAAARHFGNAIVATAVWAQLFQAAIAGIIVEDGIPDPPSEPWKRSVLETFMALSFKGLSPDEQLRRTVMLREDDQAAILMGHVSSAAQAGVKLHRLVQNGIRAAEMTTSENS